MNRSKPVQDNLEQQDFRKLVDAIPDYAIFMIDRDGKIFSWNQGASRIYGYDGSEVIGQNIALFYRDEESPEKKVKAELDEAEAKGRYQEEGWRTRKDGSRFWTNALITPLKDESGQIQGFGKITRDLTERKVAEERYRDLVDSVKDYGIFMLDKNGFVQSWNSGASRIKGYRADEIIGQHFSRFYTQVDIDRDHPSAELESAIETGRYEEEGWRVRKDGTRFWANVIITPVINAGGELIGFSKVTRNLTERKIAEEELKRAYDELEAFSYSVSHDLRAPLRSMAGFSEILEELLDEKLDPRSRDYLSRIRSSARKMSQLIDDLLNLSRLSRASLNVDKVNLSEVATKVTEEIRRSDPERANIQVEIQPNLWVEGDPNLLRIVMENLLNNAWKYTSKTEKPVISFGRTQKSGEDVFFVRDNGAGFDMRFAEKLFGAFQRLHSVDEFPGNGIGLATVRRIIHRHGGEITANGKPNEGATFSFTLRPSPTAEKDRK